MVVGGAIPLAIKKTMRERKMPSNAISQCFFLKFAIGLIPSRLFRIRIPCQAGLMRFLQSDIIHRDFREELQSIIPNAIKNS